MRSILIVVALIAGCTKKNPDACCVDEADCASIGLPVGSDCDDGLLCRENRCVELPCESSAQCDVLAPYCVGDGNGACQASCGGDADCPGFRQPADYAFCEQGACVMCRVAMGDCSGATPVCDAGGCRRCNAHSECGTGVCTDDGSCAPETEIAYVSTTGSASSGCDRNTPCTLARSLQIGIDRRFVLIGSGSYQTPGTLSIKGRTSLIGAAPRPRITNAMEGPIFTVAFGAEVTFDNLEITGARDTISPGLDGSALICPPNSNASIRVVRSALTSNQQSALRARECTFEIIESYVAGNLVGIDSVEAKGTVERSTFTGHSNLAMFLDGGLYSITNNFVYRNSSGVDILPSNTGSVLQFNTVVDNATFGVRCQVIGGDVSSFPNNLIARNAMNVVTNAECNLQNSMIVLDNDFAALKFKSPDAAPFDYHLTAGSSAVDQIGASTQTRDFDGQARPAGTGHDYGADELH